jgi:hypothetical protein
MEYQLTVRYGKTTQRYLTFTVEAADVPVALRAAADQIPAEVTQEVDLVELRVAPGFDKHPLGQDPPAEQAKE